LPKTDLADLSAGAPPPQRLVEVQHGDKGKVGHAGDGFKEPEPLNWASCVGNVHQPAQRRVGGIDEPGCLNDVPRRLTALLTSCNFGVIQRQPPYALQNLRFLGVKPGVTGVAWGTQHAQYLLALQPLVQLGEAFTNHATGGQAHAREGPCACGLLCVGNSGKFIEPHRATQGK
jgi:hypothetical protein